VLKVLKEGDFVFDAISSQSTQVAVGEIFGKIGGGKLALTLSPVSGLPDNVEGIFGMYCS
jgi:hypothetical protein